MKDQLQVGDKIIVEYPSFYSSNVEFWEMRPEHEVVRGFTRRKHNPIVGRFYTRVFDKYTGVCVSHRRGKNAPECFKRARIR